MKERFFEIARKLSYHSDHNQHHLGAVVVKKNKILGVGFNKTKTHPKSNNYYKSLHAELSAIINARGADLRGATMYVYRERKNGDLGNSKPCKYCEELIRLYEISTVYYSDESGFKEMRIA